MDENNGNQSQPPSVGQTSPSDKTLPTPNSVQPPNLLPMRKDKKVFI